MQLGTGVVFNTAPRDYYGLISSVMDERSNSCYSVSVKVNSLSMVCYFEFSRSECMYPFFLSPFTFSVVSLMHARKNDSLGPTAR